MEVNQIPAQNTDNSETNCCPRFDPTDWDDQEITFQDKLFVEASTFNLFHIPLNMGSVMTQTFKKIDEAQAANKDQFIVLSTDVSLWKGLHYFAVEKDVLGTKMTKLNGKYLTRVFEGPYKDAQSWVRELQEYVEQKGKTLKNIYFYYTTCPNCAKHFGKNYVIGFAQVA